MSIVTEEAEELLVSMVQERPALYDIREKHYANRAKKTELWGEIQNKLGIPEKELKKRWDSLRTQYTRYKKFADPGSRGAITTGRQQWILSHLQFLEPHRKIKEANSNLTVSETSTILYDSTSDGISYIKTEVPSSPGSETQCSSPTYDDCTSETDMKPCAPIEESSISDPEYTPTPIREEPWPSTSRESRPPAKRSKKQPEESSSEESKNLLRVISKTLETLASKDDNNDDISAYCKNLERKMRKLPPHILPHFQHEVDTCLYRYLIITSYNHTGQTSGAHLSQHPI
ncbi:transcription factor Adf-1-like [Sparus aurata]|uniref:transcription factor Adf-1-like n=1 Tax=Sparus aurata TaxID=8175 RepID=UPI0011C10392|nr:transcription factor Adf-1-like [Sparus aurata]